jgi:hypothetical protein
VSPTKSGKVLTNFVASTSDSAVASTSTSDSISSLDAGTKGSITAMPEITFHSVIGGVSKSGRKRSNSKTIRFEEPASEEEEEIEEGFFVLGVTPSLEEYGPHDIYLTTNSAELCVALLFDDRR